MQCVCIGVSAVRLLCAAEGQSCHKHTVIIQTALASHPVTLFTVLLLQRQTGAGGTQDTPHFLTHLALWFEDTEKKLKIQSSYIEHVAYHIVMVNIQFPDLDLIEVL